jgi:hypothetical protein
MDIYTAAEQAYKNGYEKAVKKFTDQLKKYKRNCCVQKWCQSNFACYMFDQNKFDQFVDSVAIEILEDIK